MRMVQYLYLGQNCTTASKMSKLLLETNANVETKNKDGRTPLSWAAEYGHEAVVKLLLQQHKIP
ncbi:hypothetical protein DL98DRAFT_168533 [Cadophora sp. DSE1049]|nr:hypothetical protein DL98DRAFT_168533 [Cadophora sp. DSE1049]